MEKMEIWVLDSYQKKILYQALIDRSLSAEALIYAQIVVSFRSTDSKSTGVISE